ncbi:putative periplasmic nitrate reductase [Xylogone sp. PMI_703]|nr:putative periplasmic nitrate reductase [Xylogone sp. PMI_703]
MNPPEQPYGSRDSIKDIWGERTPYKYEWPTRVDIKQIKDADRWVQSACVMCSNGCGCDIGVKDGKIVGIRGRAADRVNKGRLGPKGLHSWISNKSKERLHYPLIRKNGKLERASWDEAMSLIVNKATDVMSRLTAHGIGFYTTGQLFLEEYYALAVIGKAGLKTLNIKIDPATSMRESFGSDGQPGSYTDIDYTDCIFIVGHNNIASTQTVLWSRMLDRLAGSDPPKVVVVDPRISDTAKKATVHLAPRIGTNMAVLNGIQHLLFKNGWANEEWVKEHTIGLDTLREKIEKYNAKYVESISGIPAVQLERAAEIIGTAKSLLSTALQGVYQSNQATASACQINNINLLRGLIGKPGSGIYQMNGQPTAQNNRETGCDGEFPGFRNHMNPKHIREIAAVWNIPTEKVPHWNEPTYIQNMLKYIENGSIQMFWISGTNPLVSLPNLPRTRDLLTNPNLFVVVQDTFLTETAAIADVVLPAAQWGEKTGCFTNVDRTTHISHKAVEPPGEARADFDIFVDFGRRMDFRDKDGNLLTPWTKPEGAFNEWRRMSKGRPCDYSEMSYEKLTGGSGIQWPCNSDNPYGTERLFSDGKFFTDTEYCESFGHDLETGAPFTKEQYQAMNPAGRAILKAADYIPSLEATDEEFPLQLSTGRQVYHFHTRTKTGRVRELREAGGKPFIQISERDAEELDIKDGEEVAISSRRGQIQLPVKVGQIAKGQVFIPFHFGYWDSEDERARAANKLTQEQWDPISKQPMFKSGAVKIEKLTADEVKVHIKHQQTLIEKKVSQSKPDADTIHDASQPRVRHVEYWISATYESTVTLLKICHTLPDRFIKDHEIHSGTRVLCRLAESISDGLKPMVDKYCSSNIESHSKISHLIQDTILNHSLNSTSPYEILVAMQGFYMYLSHVESHFVALVPASQALWDKDFIEVVSFCTGQITRMIAWVKQQIKVRSPQTLLVPAPKVGEEEQEPL